MTVRELIEELQKHNPDKLVLVTAYEVGYDELKKVRESEVKHHPTEHYWKGDYDNIFSLEECNIDAILLPRS